MLTGILIGIGICAVVGVGYYVYCVGKLGGFW